MSSDLLGLFRETGALLDGHFILPPACTAGNISNARCCFSIRKSRNALSPARR